MRYATVSALMLAASLLTVPAYADSPALPANQVAQSTPEDTRKAQLDFWNSIKDSKKAEDYQAYLDKYPDGDFADLAKLRLKKYAPAAAAPAAAPTTTPPATTPDPQQADIAAWNAIKGSKNPADYLDYIDKHPNGEFVDLAKLRIQQLSTPAPAAPEPEVPAAQPASTTPAPAEPPAGTAPATPATALTLDAKDATVYAKNGGQVRAEADPKATLLTKLKTNTEIHATGMSSDGKWWRVQTADGQTGYMHKSVVSEKPVKIAPPSSKKKTQQAATAPTGPDEDVCKPDSQTTPSYRVAACERLVAKAGDDKAKIAALTDLGAALNQANRNDDSIRKYEQAAALAPRDASIYYRIGLVRLDQLRFPEARAAFEKAATIDNQDPDIVFQRGVATIGFGDFEKARLEVKRALLTKDSALYYEKLGEIEIARGDLASAKTALERGSKAEGSRPSLIRAATYYFTGDLDQAAAQVAAITDNPEAALWNALIKKAKGDDAGATAALEAGSAAAGDDWPRPVFAAITGKLSAEKARAAARDRDADVQFQQLCQLNFFIGEWAYRAGDNDAARAALQKVLDTRAYYMLEFAAAKARLANMGG